MATAPTIRMVKLSGDLDIVALPAANKLLRALDAADIAIIDMRSVTYLDSAALGMLMAARERVAEAGGALRIVSADPRLRRLLTVTGLQQSVSVFETIEEAMEAVR